MDDPARQQLGFHQLIDRSCLFLGDTYDPVCHSGPGKHNAVILHILLYAIEGHSVVILGIYDMRQQLRRTKTARYQHLRSLCLAEMLLLDIITLCVSRLILTTGCALDHLDIMLAYKHLRRYVNELIMHEFLTDGFHLAAAFVTGLVLDFMDDFLCRKSPPVSQRGCAFSFSYAQGLLLPRIPHGELLFQPR